MNRTRMLLIGVLAIAVAGVVTVFAYNQLRSKATASQRPVTRVVVADSDFAVGAMLAAKDLRLAELPTAELPAGVFHSITEVAGRGVIVPVSKNELILASKLASEKAGAGLPSLIPTRKRALSVQVNEVISVAGFVRPGARVDVLLTGKPGGSVDQMTTTVLENVEVLAAGNEIQQDAEGGKPKSVTVITLLVTPEEAQKLALASSEGRIQLTLRNPLDVSHENPSAVKSLALYRGTPAAEAAAPARGRSARPRTPEVQPPPAFVVEVIRGDKHDFVKF